MFIKAIDILNMFMLFYVGGDEEPLNQYVHNKYTSESGYKINGFDIYI